MSDVVNLNRVRKNKARADREEAAAANRVKFGRTSAEKKKSAAEEKRRKTTLDLHRRDDDR